MSTHTRITETGAVESLGLSRWIQVYSDQPHYNIEKNSVVKKQKYEEAAKLRDDEKKVEKELSDAQNKWKEDSKNNRITVNEQNIADVVSMMTNIPVTKIVKSEKNKLNLLSNKISKKLSSTE